MWILYCLCGLKCDLWAVSALCPGSKARRDNGHTAQLVITALGWQKDACWHVWWLGLKYYLWFFSLPTVFQEQDNILCLGCLFKTLSLPSHLPVNKKQTSKKKSTRNTKKFKWYNSKLYSELYHNKFLVCIHISHRAYSFLLR